MSPKRMVCMMVFISLFLVSIVFSPSHADGDDGPEVIYVGPYGNYTTIQGAIDAASNGDTIIVDDGTYFENISINKDLTIESVNGSDHSTIKGTGSVAVEVNSDYFRIEGFNISGDASGSPSPVISTGIDLTSTDNRLGMVVENCDINDFGRHGIEIHMGKNVKILNSTMRSVRDGISIDICSDTLVRNCSITAERTGIKLGGGSKNIIEGCTITGSEENLEIFNTKNNTVANNNISGGSRYGLKMYFYADGNTIVGNDFFNNEEWAINMDLSNGNWVYHNNFYNNNEGNVQARGVTDSRWDDGFLGNYWSDYRTRYPGAIGLPDGTYNATYEVLNAIGDEHPLVEPFERSDRPTIIMEEDWASKDFYETRAILIPLKALDTDTQPDDLVWSINSNASFLDIIDGNILYGIPGIGHIGTYWVNITVTDGEFTDWMNFTVEINEWYNNSLPRITTRQVTECDEDFLYSVKYEAESNHSITWSMSSNASFLTIDDLTGHLNGTPTNNDIGLYWVNVSVYDTEELDHQNFTLQVLNTNDPPIITTNNTDLWNISDTYFVDYDGIDIDPTGDVISWSLVTNCSFLSINTGTGLLSGNSTNAFSGIFWVNITASDNNGGRSHTNFSLIVFGEEDDDENYQLSVILPDEIDGTNDIFILNTDYLDMDNLTIIWYIEGIGEVGRGSSLNLTIDDGSYNLTVNITDGMGNSYERTYAITVSSNEDGPDPLQGYAFILLSCIIIAIVMILFTVFLMIRKRRHGMTSDEETIYADDPPVPIGQGPHSRKINLGSELRSGNLTSSMNSIPIEHGARMKGVGDDPIGHHEAETYLLDLKKEIINGTHIPRSETKRYQQDLKEMRRRGKITSEAYDIAIGIIEE